MRYGDPPPNDHDEGPVEPLVRSQVTKITTKIYTHNDKDTNRARGEELGLSEQAMDKFKWCAMEVEFDAEVDTETGETWATAVDGVPLAEPVQLT